MAYLRLNTTEIRRSTGKPKEDWMILAQVVQSGCSYESPRVVRELDELTAWFGKDWPGYSYLSELLRLGFSLLLYRPIQGPVNGPGTLPLHEYTRDPDFWSDPSEVPEPTKPKTIWDIGGIDHVWYEDNLVPVEALPQSIPAPDRSMSWNNRDTLCIERDFYYHPRVGVENPVTLNETQRKQVRDTWDRKKLESGTHGYAMSFDWSGVTKIPEGSYLCYWVGNDLKMIVYGESTETTPGPALVKDDNDGKHRKKVKVNQTIDDIKKETWKILRDDGWTVTEDGRTAWAPWLFRYDYFYEVPGLVIEPDLRTTQDVVWAAAKGEPLVSIESRTIGKGSDPIEVTCSPVSPGTWQVRVSRGGYLQETHTGSVIPGGPEGTKYLGATIESGSELIRARFGGEPVGGTWKMAGAVQENLGPSDTWRSLRVLTESEVIPDFLLVPDVQDYRETTKIPGKLDWYPEWPKLLEAAKGVGAQVLACNRETGEAVDQLPIDLKPNWTYRTKDTWYRTGPDRVPVETTNREWTTGLNECVWNYVATDGVDQDPGNWLVYFYREVYGVGAGEWWPGYHVFLLQLLWDEYSVGTREVLAQTPPGDPLAGGPALGPTKKSNYLVTDGTRYYYERFQDTPKGPLEPWETGTRIMTQYLIGRIRRAFQRSRWKILGIQTEPGIVAGVQGVLDGVAGETRLIEAARLTDYYLDYEKQEAQFWISVRVKELTDRDIRLNITLNYIN